MRSQLVKIWLIICSAAAMPAWAQVSFHIGINLNSYPELVPVPGYPVYYAPQLNTNYFFYDGMYWVYQDDNWYASSWYNGPWGFVEPEFVPVFVLRIPVRYYRQTPEYFYGWQLNSAPRWNEHWGNEWAQRRRGWDRWDHNQATTRPPLPIYQKNYSGDRYPLWQQQQNLQNQHYGYRAHDPLVRQQIQEQDKQDRPAASPRGTLIAPPDRIRNERNERNDRNERNERNDRSERNERNDRSERNERNDHSDRGVRESANSNQRITPPPVTNSYPRDRAGQIERVPAQQSVQQLQPQPRPDQRQQPDPRAQHLEVPALARASLAEPVRGQKAEQDKGRSQANDARNEKQNAKQERSEERNDERGERGQDRRK